MAIARIEEAIAELRAQIERLGAAPDRIAAAATAKHPGDIALRMAHQSGALDQVCRGVSDMADFYIGRIERELRDTRHCLVCDGWLVYPVVPPLCSPCIAAATRREGESDVAIA